MKFFENIRRAAQRKEEEARAEYQAAVEEGKRLEQRYVESQRELQDTIERGSPENMAREIAAEREELEKERQAIKDRTARAAEEAERIIAYHKERTESHRKEAELYDAQRQAAEDQKKRLQTELDALNKEN